MTNTDIILISIGIIIIITVSIEYYKIIRRKNVLKELNNKERELSDALRDKDNINAAQLQYKCRKLREEYQGLN